MVNNPYIDLVKEHKQIMCITEDIYKKKSLWNEYFHNDNDIVLEVGTGLGNFFSREVVKNPDMNFVWMEIKYKRLYITAEKALWNLNNYVENWVRPKWVLRRKTEENSPLLSKRGTEVELLKSEANSSTNFVLLKDKWEHIVDIFWENEISLSYVFFPDPWAKKKRRLKNRLLQEKFLTNLYNITKIWWRSIIKTDHLWYFEFVLEEVAKTWWKIVKKSYDWENENNFDNSETTEFQQLFRWQDIKINYIELEK